MSIEHMKRCSALFRLNRIQIKIRKNPTTFHPSDCKSQELSHPGGGNVNWIGAALGRVLVSAGNPHVQETLVLKKDPSLKENLNTTWNITADYFKVEFGFKNMYKLWIQLYLIFYTIKFIRQQCPHFPKEQWTIQMLAVGFQE